VGAGSGPEGFLLGGGDRIVVVADLADDPGTYAGRPHALLDLADHLLRKPIGARGAKVVEVEIRLAVVPAPHHHEHARRARDLGQPLRGTPDLARGELY